MGHQKPKFNYRMSLVAQTEDYDEYRYRGFTIYHNFKGSRFDTDYWTAVKRGRENQKDNHCHCNSSQQAKSIVNMAYSIKNNRYIKGNITMRNIANRLLTGQTIYSK